MALTTVEFERLLEANRTLSSQLEIDRVLMTILRLATDVVQAEAASILLLDEKTNELYFDVALGAAQESVKQIRLKVGEGVAGWVAQENKPLIVNDVSQDSRFAGRVDKSTSFKTKSILALPLSAKGRLVGVIEAINKKNDQGFTADDQEIFEAFAGQSAIAIENARLFSAVKLEKEKLNTVFAQMNDGVFLLDDKGTALLLNRAAATYLGHSVTDGVGKTFGAELFSGFEMFPSFEEIKNIKGDTGIFELARHELKDLFLVASVHRLSAEARSNPGGYLVVLHDVTEEKREGRLKRNFLSLISHKLKTPLTVILGYAPALAMNSDGLSDFQKKAIHAIGEQGGALANLVDKLLRFSIIESDDTIKTCDRATPSAMLQKAIQAFDDLAQEGKVTFEMDGGLAGLPAMPTDQSLFVEVVKNIIENGIKFNDNHRKVIQISAKADDDTMVISISDNGVGIPPEEKERIFQKFYQIENSFTGQIPGAGLGLPFCKKVIEALGGTIAVESVLGRGSTFSLSLPKRGHPEGRSGGSS